jgi:predicted ATPase
LSLDLADLLATTSRPLLLVIDDLHDADPSSLQLLAKLATGSAGVRCGPR